MYEIPIGMSSYALVFGNVYHLPLDLELRTLWMCKKLNFGSNSQKRQDKYYYMSSMNDNLKLMRMSRFTKKRQRHDMIIISINSSCILDKKYMIQLTFTSFLRQVKIT